MNGKTILTPFNVDRTGARQITFNFVEKLFQTRVYERVEEILKKDTAKPLVMEFDITSTCNQNCAACISKVLLNHGEIPFSKIKSLLDLFSNAGLKAVIFTGGGEPLLHAAMPEPLLYSKTIGLDVGLITNGVLLDRYSRHFPGVLSWIRVSIDACEPGKYNLLHYNRPSKKTNIFKNIIASMENFASKKKETRLGFSFLVFIGEQWSGSEYDNVSQIFDACGLAKNTGCDYFEIKPVVEQDHSLYLTRDELNRLSEQYRACKELVDDEFSVYSAESLQNVLEKRGDAESSEFRQAKDYSRCLVARLRTMVSPEGIFPCPYFRGSKKFGDFIDLTETPLTPDAYNNILNRIGKKINPSVDCNLYCIRHKQNIVLNKLLCNDLTPDKASRSNTGDPKTEDLFI